MKTFSPIFLAAGLTALASTSALAGVSNIKDMENGASVKVSGTVESVQNEREFTLRDQTGTIKVDIESDQSVVLKKGDTVSVSGMVDKGILGTDINASKVNVDKNIAKAIGDSIEGNTSISLEGAKSYSISQLPKKGLVKISGTVSDVDNEKEFTLRDSTGSINVDVESAETAALTEGAKVTVIGRMDSDLFGKDLNASKVLVTADAGKSSKEKANY